MTFTPGSFDPERTDTIEAQKKLQEDDVSAQEEFDKAQRPINFLYKAGKAASDLFGPAGLGDLFDWLKGRAEGKQEDIPVSVLNVLPKDNTKALVSQTSTITPSVLDIFGGTATPAQKKLINNLKLKLDDKNKNIYDGLEGEEVIKKYMENQGIELTQDDEDPVLDLLTGAQIRTKRVNRKTIRNLLVQYPNISDDRVDRYIKLNERGVEDVAKTIKFLNNLYAQNTPSGEDLEDVAAEFSVIFGVDATVQDLQNIIEERGNLVFKTASMDKPFIIRNLEELQAAYFDRLNVLKKANVFDEGHVFAVNNLLRDKNVTNIATYRSNVEPEIARSIEQLIDKQTLEELISPGQGPAYLEQVVLGNRSRKDENDPDKAIARVFGAAYGVEEDFLNFMLPNQTVASKVPPDLKDTFVDLYNKELTALLQNFPKSKPGQGPSIASPGEGGVQFGIFTLQKLKDQIQNLVAEEMGLASGLAKALSETEYQRIKKENPEILLYLDERFGGKEQYVVPDKPAKRIRRKGIDTRGLNEFRVGSSWDIGE